MPPVATSIEPIQVVDDRLTNPQPQNVIQTGATNLTATPFTSQSVNPSSCTFTVLIPDYQTVIDRKVDWSMSVNMYMDFANGADGPGSDQYPAFPTDPPVTGVPPYTNDLVPPPYARLMPLPGREWALCASPLHSLVGTMSCNPGGQNVSNNLALTREIISLFTDSATARAQRTQPACLDVFADYADAKGTNLDPIAGYETATTMGTIGNGAWPIQWLDDKGNLITMSNRTYAVAGQYTIKFYPPASALITNFTTKILSVDPKWNGTMQPYLIWSSASALARLYFRFSSVEPLQLSPFIWIEQNERGQGMSQMQTLQFTFTLQLPQQANMIRTNLTPSATDVNLINANYSTPFSLAAYGYHPGTTPFLNAALNCQFLTPPAAVLEPSYRNIVPIEQFSPVQQFQIPTSGIQNGQLTTNSQTITLGYIPTFIILAVTPTQQYRNSPAARSQATWYAPISSVNLTWANQNGLLSAQTQEELHAISFFNGLKMPFEQWRGWAQTSNVNSFNGQGTVQLTGGPLILKPGIDLTLPVGQASGQSNSQYNFQAQVTVDLSHVPAYILNDPAFGLNMTIIPINSGFMVTEKGSTAMFMGITQPGAPLITPVQGSIEGDVMTRKYNANAKGQMLLEDGMIGGGRARVRNVKTLRALGGGKKRMRDDEDGMPTKRSFKSRLM